MRDSNLKEDSLVNLNKDRVREATVGTVSLSPLSDLQSEEKADSERETIL